jgi:hypothetical protein
MKHHIPKVHLVPRVSFEGLMTNNYRSNLALKVLYNYDIEKGNTNDELKSIWSMMNKKGKVTKILEDYRKKIILFVS